MNINHYTFKIFTTRHLNRIYELLYHDELALLNIYALVTGEIHYPMILKKIKLFIFLY